jgi:hypothetical protein
MPAVFHQAVVSRSRCPLAALACSETEPELVEIAARHAAACRREELRCRQTDQTHARNRRRIGHRLAIAA